jgi:Sap, sulfolipid-1-addressing protein
VGVVLGPLLPFAVVVALSPVPVIAVVLLLLADRAAETGVGFLLGWVVGIAGGTAVSLFVVSGTEPGARTRSVVSWGALVVGLLLLPLALRQWRSRPAPGEQPALPAWVGAIDRFTPSRAGGLGLVLSAVSPKNLPVCVAAGAAIAGGDLSRVQDAWAVAVFTAVAASTVAVPVLAYAVLGSRMAGPLESLRRWLTVHSARATALLLLAIGVVLVGQGLGGVR